MTDTETDAKNNFSNVLHELSRKNEKEQLQYLETNLKILEYPNICDPFIYVDNNALTTEICSTLIEMFEKDSQHHLNGVTGGGYNPSIKKTRDFSIHASYSKDWEKFDTILKNSLTSSLKVYIKDLYNKFHIHMFKDKYSDVGYMIQKYLQNDGFYSWHHDNIINNKNCQRVLTFIWYLNDVDEGGETFFLFGKIKPKAGKLLIFPATWTYFHKGNVPISNDKYIITGWLSGTS